MYVQIPGQPAVLVKTHHILWSQMVYIEDIAYFNRRKRTRSAYREVDPGEMEGWVSLGWLVGYIPKQMSGTGNWTRTRSPISVLTGPDVWLTSLIKDNALTTTEQTPHRSSRASSDTVSFTFTRHTWQFFIFTIATRIFSYSFSLSFWT